MKKRLSLAVAVLAVAALEACGPGYHPVEGVQNVQVKPEDDHRVFRVHYDGGGNILDYVRELSEIQRNGDRVEIVGTCLSSCTLYLGANDVCVAPDAVLGFHGPRGYLGIVPLSPSDCESYRRIMAMSYPPGIREPFLEKWCNFTLRMQTLTGQEVADMCPAVRLCD